MEPQNVEEVEEGEAEGGRGADPGQKNHQIRKDAIEKYREEMAALELVTMSLARTME